MAKKSDIKKFESEITWPIEGVDEERAYSRQRPGTAADSLNVRAFDPATDRARGGSRPGLEKVFYTNYDESEVTDLPVQEINQLTTLLPPAPVTGDYQQFTYGHVASTATVTMTVASPCVVTWTSHGLVTYNTVSFTTTGALPTGLSVSTRYWITKIDANTFNLSTSLANAIAGTFITTTGSQSGTHTGIQSGFSIGTGNDGLPMATLPTVPISGEAMSCSCWDDEGYCYVAMTHATNNTVKIYKVSQAGVVQSNWPIGNYTITGSSLRSVAGIAWIRISPTLAYVFVALTSTIAKVFRFNASTGISPDGSFAFTETNATLQNLTFSTSAHNVLCCGAGMLVVESAGTPAGSNQGLRAYDPAQTPITAAVANAGTVNSPYSQIPGLLWYLGWGGTRSNEATRVVTDGSAFYCIASQSTNKLKKVSSGGVLLAENTTGYQTTGSGSPTAMDYDLRLQKIVIGSTVSPYVRLFATSGITSTWPSPTPTADPGSSAQWDEVGSDGNGTFMLWRNSATSNSFMTVDSTLTADVALTHLANGNNTGASVNKGVGSAPPIPGQSQTILVSVMVKGGLVNTFDEYGPKDVTNGQSLHSGALYIQSAQIGPYLFFADGSGAYKKYNGTDNIMQDWTLTDGTLPRDDNGNSANKICAWNGRIVLAIGRNFYMSRQYDPLDFDYEPAVSNDSTRAFSGNADLAGSLGNLINFMVPFDDDTMLFFMDHEIWQLTGNPTVDGAFDVISQTLGGVYGRPFAFDPQGTLYFFGSDMGIYKMKSSSEPVPISKQIRRRLQAIDLSTHRVVMCWDQIFDGLGVWITPLDRYASTTNFFWERRSEAWQPEKYGNTAHNPMVAYAYDGDLQQDRAVYLGGRDGFIRRLAADLGDDDGTPIESWILLGPIMTKEWDNLVHERLLATLDDESGEVRYDLYWGRHAEEALAQAEADIERIALGKKPLSTIHGTWKAGRNRVSPTLREGFAFYLKLSSSTYWCVERIMQAFRTTGVIRKWQ